MTENDQSTILITGATGTVGSEVVNKLSSAGQNVRVRAAVSIDKQGCQDKSSRCGNNRS